MAQRHNDRPTYPELLNFYYKCGFPSILKGNANSVAHAIMFKWNQLFMPSEFPMSNMELSCLSGVDSHIGRSRQKVVAECRIDAVPLISYVTNGRQKAGTYRINSTLIPNSNQTQPKLSQNSAKLEPPSLIQTKLNKTKQKDARVRKGRSKVDIIDDWLHKINGKAGEDIANKGAENYEEMCFILSHYSWEEEVAPAIKANHEIHFADRLSAVVKQVTGENYEW